jgi:uncharacterized membrane protein YedE/YeeE
MQASEVKTWEGGFVLGFCFLFGSVLLGMCTSSAKVTSETNFEPICAAAVLTLCGTGKYKKKNF